jgi:cardiolipin synthase
MKQLFTYANQLTLIRLALIPFYAVTILQGRYRVALILLVVAGLSDGLDGLLARWLKQRTTLGALLDPIADKILLSTSFVVLAISGDVPRWVSILVLSRDVLMVIVASVVTMVTGFRPFPPTLLGKVCTGVQIVTVFWVVLGRVWPPVAVAEPFLLWLTVGFTVVSGFHYAIRTGKDLPH